ncbi:growth hormone secretagogue receptor type 1-like [Lineus longissimus]|uniref:growth hormone secretagogue receptor type 1-like n=1 Tax=Lineus longissimus TaxID=88925 RepID=UPI00315C7CF5
MEKSRVSLVSEMANSSSNVTYTTPTFYTRAAEVDKVLQYFEDLITWFSVYLPLGVVVIGVAGNLLSFLLLSRAQYKSSSTCFYTKMLAISDSMYLMTLTARISSEVTDFIFGEATVYCIFLNGFKRLWPAVSSILLTAMSVDRCIAVVIPLRARVLCSVYRANLVTCFIVIIAAVLHIGTQVGRAAITENGTNDCIFRKLPGMWGYYYAHFRIITTYYIPLSLVFVSNLGIISVVSSNRRRRLRLQNGRGQGQTQKDGGSHITTMLLAVSGSSILCQLPNQISRTYFNYTTTSFITPRAIAVRTFTKVFAEFFLYCNYGMNFYAYTLPIAKFRRELREMLVSVKAISAQ